MCIPALAAQKGILELQLSFETFEVLHCQAAFDAPTFPTGDLLKVVGFVCNTVKTRVEQTAWCSAKCSL